MAFPDIEVANFFDANAGTPSLDLLKTYDVVLVWRNSTWKDKTAMGNVLGDYVDLGGHVIIGTFNWQSGASDLEGRIMGASFTPFTGATSIDHTTTILGTHNSSHPIMIGVTSLQSGHRMKGM
ncbi:MAG TPA: hypothetical protein DIT99_22280, partial [Candidatus Latescibacteria bacterium]|nr:hypothetical protein [Candidatus Latescibacterota bacterium]